MHKFLLMSLSLRLQKNGTYCRMRTLAHSIRPLWHSSWSFTCGLCSFCEHERYCVVHHRQDAGKASEMVQVEILHQRISKCFLAGWKQHQVQLLLPRSPNQRSGFLPEAESKSLIWKTRAAGCKCQVRPGQPESAGVAFLQGASCSGQVGQAKSGDLAKAGALPQELMLGICH
jgi:hypothetical protein